MGYFALLSVLLLNTHAICFLQTNDFELLVMHNSDMHSRFEETSRHSSTCTYIDKKKNQCYGGFARTAHLIRKARMEAINGQGPNVIYLNAGDTYTGTQWFSVHKAKIVAEFMNVLGPNAISFGNHEFDLNIPGVVPFINAARFPIVAANLDFSNEPSVNVTRVTKSVILNIGGRKIGIIGYLLPETRVTSGAQTVIFRDEAKSIKEESEKLDKQGVKIIIALGHSGIETDIRIAKEVPLVDLVIGGHTNTFLWNGIQPDLEQPYGNYPLSVKQQSGKVVYVAQAYAYTKYMGHLKVKFNKTGDVTDCKGQPVLMDYTIPQDPDVLELLEKFRPEVDNNNHQIVGVTKVALHGGTDRCRYKECNLGNLIADAFVEYYISRYTGEYWTDAPIAVINAGYMRASVKSENGTLTRGNLMDALPFDNSVVVVSLEGKDLLRTLEIGVRNNNDTSQGEFLHTSGLFVVYDLSKPVNSRVVGVKARCGKCNVPVYEPVEPNKLYRIITSGFVAAGGDGHLVFKEGGRDKIPLDTSMLDILVWYIRKQTPVHPEVSGRSIFLTSKVEDTPKAKSNLSFVNFLRSFFQ